MQQQVFIGSRSVGWRALGACAALVMGWAVATGPAKAAPPRIVDIAAGFTHTCAVDDTGRAWCWGDGSDGQLGNGDLGNQTTPARVRRLRDATKITTGFKHTCALRATGAAKCWGRNGAGQLGDGTTTPRAKPVRVTGLRGAKDISAGSGHTCAVLESGIATCWGNNLFGQLGDGTRVSKTQPVQVQRLSDASQIVAGSRHTCALRATRFTPAYGSRGDVKCWGQNNDGQLGNNSENDSSIPVRVRRLRGAAQLSARQDHTCAVIRNGRVKCWGQNDEGQLGIGRRTFFSRVPVFVKRLRRATQVATGYTHSCATLSNGRVKCWGNNLVGQLGDGTGTDRLTPVFVPGLRGVTKISAGFLHTCALLETGAVKCWGSGFDGQLGNGSTSFSRTPVDVIFPDVRATVAAVTPR